MKTEHAPVIVWFRQDLRLADQPALSAACRAGRPVIPVFIWAPGEAGEWAPGGAGRWWLHQSLKSLAADIQKKGSRLILRSGSSLKELKKLAVETGAGAVYWNRSYEPWMIHRDAGITAALKKSGIETQTFNAALLFEPWQVKNKTGGPYKVFTPFWNQIQSLPPSPRPEPAPPRIPAPSTHPSTLALADLKLEPEINWAGGMRKVWRPGEAGAAAELKRFIGNGIISYSAGRDRPDHAGTSRLSPHLHFGEISPGTVWHSAGRGTKALPYLRQIVWREFAHHLIYHFPHTAAEPLRPEFKKFPWKKNARLLRTWQKGCTGYPLVDAGMRELWTTGWMHNRVRMIAASLLVKHFLIPWQEGAKWFWDTLVDADLANNTMGWQWVAGSGADAAPYFRIFNPVSQGEKFDPEGAYVRRWVPELAGLPAAWIHKPWQAPAEILARAGVRLGQTYPKPVVEHGLGRRRALAAYDRMKLR